MTSFEKSLSESPLIAILRGIETSEVIAVVDVLLDCGIGIVEVPLNSPNAFDSIALIARNFGGRVVTGAGTVLDPASVSKLKDVGGTLVVSHNCNPLVIAEALKLGLIPLPGVATPTEAFSAINAGARFLKLFPAGVTGPATLKALKSVLPNHAKVIPVGGISPDNLAEFGAAGADAYGIGNALYARGMSLEQVKENALSFAKAVANR
jgi:2-dehydro-3-deoxyphosphogalactonate aldolase